MVFTKTEMNGVTVITLTSDPSNPCPPLCQILKTLCYNPSCCTMSQHLRRIQGTSQSLLGALQIVIGVLNIGCGAILTGSAPWWQTYNYLYPFWLGAMFIFFGVMCILSEKCPSPCLVILNVILNLLGVCFAIAAIILCSLSIIFTDMTWICHQDKSYPYDYDSEVTQSPIVDSMEEKCLDATNMLYMTFLGLFVMLIVLSVLELCIVISSAVLGIKALVKSRKGENKSLEDSDACKRLLEEASSNPAV